VVTPASTLTKGQRSKVAESPTGGTSDLMEARSEGERNAAQKENSVFFACGYPLSTEHCTKELHQSVNINRY
jgi:hypothetical protein